MEENSNVEVVEAENNTETTQENSVVIQENGIHEIKEPEIDLSCQIQEFKSTISNLKDEVAKKADVITDLEKLKAVLEKEVIQLKRDRENAVIRYATVEKQILDSKNGKEFIEKKNKELQREIELLNGKIKGANGDKTRICGILDAKCHELKASQKEIEKLKYDNSAQESKFKWHQSKFKQETEAREIAEKKIEELTAEINQMKLKEINRAKEEVEIERNMLAEKQMMEQNATLILLKHNNEEKTRKIEVLEKKCNQLESELQALNSKHLTTCQEFEKMSHEQTYLNQQVNDSQCLLDKQMMKIAELQSNQNDLEKIRTQLSIEKESNRQMKNELSSLTAQIDEQNLETEKWKEKEIELLQLNKELTETVVKMKNECSIITSKTTAISLENQLIKKDKNYYEGIIEDLRSQLDGEIKKKNSDCQLMSKHISDKARMIENLQTKNEEALGELEAQQKKYLQTVKELNREINQLRKKVESVSRDEQGEKKSPTPSFTSESSADSHVNEYPKISLEPSQKSLIDRIVRLQNEIVRQSEKIDFLENHQAQLVEELKRYRKTNKK
ncbi:CLUMA_CG008235, isoform A [Clunio marinus]|uniref:CLUMA_CG008235, isoform A n=1 Tax=Clunio marinus TaxID=568069 RepID=A0A1J1I308_9DIPT|nr:CLUMA_CG008235, isoform A [Clunio marinus]